MKYIKLFDSWDINLSQWAIDEYGEEAKVADRFNLGPFKPGKGFSNYSSDLYFFDVHAGFVVVDPDSRYTDRVYNNEIVTSPKYQRKDKDFSDIDKFMNNKNYLSICTDFLYCIKIIFLFHYNREDFSTGQGVSKCDIASFNIKIPVYNNGDKIYINTESEPTLSNENVFKDEKSEIKFKNQVFPLLLKCKEFKEFFNDFTTYANRDEWRKLMTILKTTKYN